MDTRKRIQLKGTKNDTGIVLLITLRRFHNRRTRANKSSSVGTFKTLKCVPCIDYECAARPIKSWGTVFHTFCRPPTCSRERMVAKPKTARLVSLCEDIFWDSSPFLLRFCSARRPDVPFVGVVKHTNYRRDATGSWYKCDRFYERNWSKQLAPRRPRAFGRVWLGFNSAVIMAEYIKGFVACPDHTENSNRLAPCSP